MSCEGFHHSGKMMAEKQAVDDFICCLLIFSANIMLALIAYIFCSRIWAS
jgi:hypothetical protein